jgi:FtsH-binding integral membrane protein
VTSLIRPTLAAPPRTGHDSAGRRLTSEPGVRFGIANGAVVTVFLAASVARLRPEEIAWLAVLTAGLTAVGLRWAVSASLGLIAWAWYTGFVENTYGQLTFATDDVRRLAAFVLTSAVVAALSHRVWFVIKESTRG